MALLFSYGHRRFAFLGEAQKSHLYVSPSQRRLAGYRAALAEAGYPLTESDTRLTAHGVEPESMETLKTFTLSKT